jgi:hypothetical protein
MTLPDELYLRTLVNDFGVSPGETMLAYQQDTFIGNGSTTVFNLTQTPNNMFPPFVYLNGVLQNSGYSVLGTTLTFLAAPTAAVLILCIYSY